MMTNNLSNVSGAATFLALQMLAEGGSDVSNAIFVANYTYAGSRWSCDKTFAEIKDAYDAGKPCLAVGKGLDGYYRQYYIKNGTVSQFVWESQDLAGSYTTNGKIIYWTISHDQDDTINSGMQTYYVLPSVSSSDNGKVLGVSNGQWNVASDKGTPYEVVFTITDSPSGTSYPVSVTTSLADIYEAVRRGDRVFGSVAMNTTDIAFGTLSAAILNGTADGYRLVAFDMIVVNFGIPQVGHATIYFNGDIETATLNIVNLAMPPRIVNYTITGLPVDGIYPMSANATLIDILADKGDGLEVKAVLRMPEGTLELPLISYGNNGSIDFAAFSNVTCYNGEWVIFQINTANDGVSDVSHGEIVPLQQQLPSAQGVDF